MSSTDTQPVDAEVRTNPTRTPERMKALAARRGRLLEFAKEVIDAAERIMGRDPEKGGGDA